MTKKADPVRDLERALAAVGDGLARMQGALDSMESGLVWYGADDRLLFCNRRFREIYAEVAALLVPGAAYADIARAFHRSGYARRTELDEDAYVAARVARHLDPDERDYEFQLETGTWLWASDRKTADGGVIGVRLDITEKKKIEAKIRELAEFDHLTGLPNRMLLSARYDFAARQAERAGDKLALLFIGLDRFKSINDSLGHHLGDGILAETAQRLQKSVRSTDTVARHGSDEFIVLLPGVSDAPDLAHIAELVQSAVARPHLFEDREVSFTASIGVAVWPADGNNLADLVHNADLAMHHSKSEGRNQFSFFRAEMNEHVSERLTIETALRQALRKNEFTLCYQPIFRLPERRMIGAEALLRWHSETLGEIGPAQFIPVAEDCGLIADIGEWVAFEACRQLRYWRDAGLDEFPITVNLSARQFQSRRLVEMLRTAVSQHGLQPADLEIELTESAMVAEGAVTNGALTAMAEAGFQLVIDDFGTGYSNLAYLKRFDIAKLKIDQSFVRDITTDPDDAAITRGIIGLAKSIGLRVVAEGVEHQSQLDYLLASGCEEAQGFLLSKPLPPAVFQSRF
ncbi:MAG: EAL domain-containing protein [Betaproteobacteria bacterium]|nr:EAL domain-containing protein [Betaproteobacteria bacterium]